MQIAEDMLRFSPQYELQTDLQLFIPGSLLEQRLRFPSPVVLYVSDNNPGAAAAAGEMQSAFSDLRVTVTPPASVRAAAEAGQAIGSSHHHESAGETNVLARLSGLEPTHFLLYLNERTYSGTAGGTLHGAWIQPIDRHSPRRASALVCGRGTGARGSCCTRGESENRNDPRG